jgi:hypothetical protein
MNQTHRKENGLLDNRMVGFVVCRSRIGKNPFIHESVHLFFLGLFLHSGRADVDF